MAKPKLHSALTSRLPSKGNAGDVFYCTDTGNVYLAVADGTLLDMASLLNPTAAALAVGPKGEPGIAGAPGARGEKGEKGDKGEVGPEGKAGSQGRAGKDGHDGQRGKEGARGERGERGSQGPQGIQGPQGEKGERGDVLYVGKLEIEAAAEKMRQERAWLRAKIAQLRDDNSRAKHQHMKILKNFLLDEIERCIH